MSLNKDAILAIKPTPVKVTTPYGDVFVVGMSGLQKSKFESAQINYDGNTVTMAKDSNNRGMICAFCITDEAGKRLFEDKDAGKLGNRPSAFTDPIFDKVMDLSGLTKESKEKIEKN